MEQINNILAKLGLSVKNALYIVGAALAVWLLLGTKKGRTYVRRARRTTARRATSTARRATGYVRRRYTAYRTRRVARRK
jgi:hypothetical protein